MDKHSVFIHIPKTGGTSIIKAFGLKSPSSHASFEEYQMFLSQPKRYFYFTFVRNPWARLVSFYRYARMDKSMYHDVINPAKAPFGKHIHYDLFTTISFKQMVYYLIEDRLVPYDNSTDFMRPQTYWVEGQDNTNQVDFIGKLEHVQTDYAKICKKIGLPVAMVPQSNASGNPTDYQSYYDSETRHLVEKYYAEDIEMFKYSF